jgi:hypothetical protein
MDRRKLIKTTALATSFVTTQWYKPVLNAVVTPTHAQTTNSDLLSRDIQYLNTSIFFDNNSHRLGAVGGDDYLHLPYFSITEKSGEIRKLESVKLELIVSSTQHWSEYSGGQVARTFIDLKSVFRLDYELGFRPKKVDRFFIKTVELETGCAHSFRHSVEARRELIFTKPEELEKFIGVDNFTIPCGLEVDAYADDYTAKLDYGFSSSSALKVVLTYQYQSNTPAIDKPALDPVNVGPVGIGVTYEEGECRSPFGPGRPGGTGGSGSSVISVGDNVLVEGTSGVNVDNTIGVSATHNLTWNSILSTEND